MWMVFFLSVNQYTDFLPYTSVLCILSKDLQISLTELRHWWIYVSGKVRLISWPQGAENSPDSVSVPSFLTQLTGFWSPEQALWKAQVETASETRWKVGKPCFLSDTRNPQEQRQLDIEIRSSRKRSGLETKTQVAGPRVDAVAQVAWGVRV